MPNKKGMLRPYSLALIEVNRVFDGAIIIFSLWLAQLWLGLPWEKDSFILSFAAIAVFTFTADFNLLYRSWRSMPLRKEVQTLITCWVITATLLAAVSELFGYNLENTRRSVYLWLLIAPTTLCFTRAIIRIVLRYFRIKGHNYRTAAIVGANELGLQLNNIITHSSWMGLRSVGFYDDRIESSRISADFDHSMIKGSINELLALGMRGEIDIVYITLPMRAELRIKKTIDAFSDTTIRIYFVPDLFALDLLNAEWETVDGLPIVGVVETPIHGVHSLAKRVEDIVLASVVLTLLWVPMLLVALAIKLTSPGPAIYKQKRCGLNGKMFEIYKFRTMRSDENKEYVQAVKDDPRTTRIGAILRATSLDELPQFFNVLQGRMSVVGPRPHPTDLNEGHRAIIHRYWLRHIVKPGITGWAQVNGFRGETDTLEKMERRIAYDLEYIREWSLWLDMKIIFATLFVVFSRENAY